MSRFTVPWRRAVVAAAASGALAAGMLAAAGPARADVLACGSTITSSVRLTQDMDCGGTAIVVGAAGVTVDLNGHQIIGGGGTGISDVGHNDVTVEHGTITGFLNDVSIEDSSGSVVRDLTVRTEYLGGAVDILLTKDSGTTVTHSHFIHPYIGGEDDQGNGNTWSDNTFDDLGFDGSPYSLIGLAVLRSTGDLISGNKLIGRTVGPHLPAADGVYFTQDSGTTITKNEMQGLAVGLQSMDNTSSTISLNNGFHNEDAVDSSSSTDEAYTGNRFSDNHIDGMLIDSPHGAKLTGNTTSGNPVYGVFVTGQEGADSATLSLNTADHNKYGLYSQFPTTGFGNKAKDNAVSDCFNVNCNLPVPIAVGHIPVSVAVGQATDTIYVTRLDGKVSAIDGHTHAVTATIAVGLTPVSVAVDQATDTIYVANYLSGTVSAIDGHSHAITATIPVGQGPFGVAVDPATDTIYVANYLADTVSAIDGHTHAITATIAVGHHPQAVAVDQATETVYVANYSSDTVSAIDGHSHAITATIPVGHGPRGVAVDSAKDIIYVTNSGSDTVSAIDGHSHAITATIAVGHGPNGVAVDPVTDTVYVANSGSDTVSVIP